MRWMLVMIGLVMVIGSVLGFGFSFAQYGIAQQAYRDCASDPAMASSGACGVLGGSVFFWIAFMGVFVVACFAGFVLMGISAARPARPLITPVFDNTPTAPIFVASTGASVATFCPQCGARWGPQAEACPRDATPLKRVL